MKIEVAPWIRDYVVDMEELYSELTLEKIQNKAYGPDGRVLGHYREMFGDFKRVSGRQEATEKSPGRLVLVLRTIRGFIILSYFFFLVYEGHG